MKTVEEFLSQFDLSKFAQRFDSAPDVCFLDIKELSQLVSGKQPAFNQCKNYYRKISTKLIVQLLQTRSILQEVVSGKPSNEPLVQLAWTYQLMAKYHETAEVEPDQQLLNEILNQLYSSKRRNSFQEFTVVVGEFVHKWRYVLSKVTGKTEKLTQLINQKMTKEIQLNVQEFYKHNQSFLSFLRQFEFIQVQEFCELIQQYLIKDNQICYLDAIDYLILFISETKLIVC